MQDSSAPPAESEAEPIPREEQAAVVSELETAAREAAALSRSLLTFLGLVLFVVHSYFGLRALAVAVDPEGEHVPMRHHAALALVVPASVATLVEAASALAAALGFAAGRLGLDGVSAGGKAANPRAERRQGLSATLAGAAVALSGAVALFWLWALFVAKMDAAEDEVRRGRAKGKVFHLCFLCCKRYKPPVRKHAERKEVEGVGGCDESALRRRSPRCCSAPLTDSSFFLLSHVPSFFFPVLIASAVACVAPPACAGVLGAHGVRSFLG